MGNFLRSNFKYLFAILILENVRFTESTFGPPKIGVYKKNYRGNILETYGEIPNSEVTITRELDIMENYYNGTYLEMDCEASYPVKWVYKGIGAPIGSARTSRSFEKFGDKSTYKFQATLLFTHTDPYHTGNYSCEMIKNDGSKSNTFASHFYTFFPSNKGEKIFLLDTNVVHNVKVNPNVTEWVNIPCAVSNPSTQVTLCKENDFCIRTSNRLSSSNILYSPTFGFKLNLNDYPNLWGKTFTCSSSDKMAAKRQSETGSLKIVVQKQQASESNEVKPEIRFSFSKESKQLSCCSKIKPPTMKMVNCANSAECSILENRLDRKKSNPEQYTSSSSGSESCTSYQFREFKESGLLQCSVGEEKKYQQFTYEFNNLYTEFDTIPQNEDSLIKLHVEDSRRGSDYKRIACHTSQFFFSNGIIWGIGENKEATHLEFIKPRRNRNWMDINVNDINGKVLFCFAPVWNYFEWKNVSHVN